ncbi:MAG TPA: hypothetical protein VGM10_19980 [Actinocrinis sp.]
MSDLRATISFAANLYRQKAATAHAAYLRRDPTAQLHLRPGRENPYAVYERIRAAGPLMPTRLGNLATVGPGRCGGAAVRRCGGATA